MPIEADSSSEENFQNLIFSSSPSWESTTLMGMSKAFPGLIFYILANVRLSSLTTRCSGSAFLPQGWFSRYRSTLWCNHRSSRDRSSCHRTECWGSLVNVWLWRWLGRSRPGYFRSEWRGLRRCWLEASFGWLLGVCACSCGNLNMIVWII